MPHRIESPFSFRLAEKITGVPGGTVPVRYGEARGIFSFEKRMPPRPPKEKRGGISISPRTPLKRHKGRGPGPRLWNPTTGGWPGARRHGRLIRPGALLPAAPGVFLAELRPRIWELGIHRGAKRTHFASLSAGAGWIKEKGGRMPSFQSVEKVRLELGFSDRYGRMDKGDERYWNAGKWIEIW